MVVASTKRGRRRSSGRIRLLAVVLFALARRASGGGNDEGPSSPEQRPPAQGPAPFDSAGHDAPPHEQLPAAPIPNRRERPAPKDPMYGFAPMPEHCLEPKTGHVIVKGERHSGTNFVTRLLRHNTRRVEVDQSVVARRYGWKHGHWPPAGGTGVPFNATEDTLVIITRDAFTWLAKMMEEAYDPLVNARRRDGFSAFLRAPYANVCHDEEDNLVEDSICETAANLVQARTLKYKQWLSDDPDEAAFAGGSKGEFLQSRIHIKLESIANYGTDDDLNTERQLQHLRDPLSSRCVKAVGDRHFRPVNHHVSPRARGSWAKPRIDHDEEGERLLQQFTKEDLLFVLSQLDLEFERKIGYTYDYIFEMLGEV